MRLLNTESLEFKEFFDSQIPEYAILSHTWGDEEVTFQEFRKGKRQDSQGYAKIRQCCVLAASRGFQWVWIDTCCIDKKSSAELSEAINSMYRWYSEAGECYAYLSDVVWDFQDTEASKEALRKSVWFTRGWTLQELLAPENVIFLDNGWIWFGTKDELSREISAVTGITFFSMNYPLFASVAQKMSWLSRRTTSRAEDMAYCMLGLFDINMSLLYGEGKKAFMRLQLEIIKVSDDESIFAWTSPSVKSGMLASDPLCFIDSGDIIPTPWALNIRSLRYSMTNKGLELQVPYRQPDGRAGKRDISELSIELNCLRVDKELHKRCITIQIERSEGRWQRINRKELFLGREVDLRERLKEFRDGGEQKETALIHIPTVYQPMPSSYNV